MPPRAIRLDRGRSALVSACLGAAKKNHNVFSTGCENLPAQRARGAGADGMLLSDLATVRAASIVLASGSPRRVDMFNALLKLNARVVPSAFPNPKPNAKANPHASRTALSFCMPRPTQADPNPDSSPSPKPKPNPDQVPSTFPEDLDKSLYTPESCVARRARTRTSRPQAGLLLTRLSLWQVCECSSPGTGCLSNNASVAGRCGW